MANGSTSAHPSAARERLLATAAALFYTEGIRAVGVDRIISEAPVTRATFYRHFASKEALVLEYVESEDRAIRARVEHAAAATDDPRELLRLLVVDLGEQICAAGFRGCPFINAAAEYPDPDHPVRRAVAVHREWFLGTIDALMAAVGHPDPPAAARVVVFLRDGAMVGGYLGDPAQVMADMRSALERVVAG